MENYKVQFDQKVTAWTRETFFIDAESPEEALKLAKENQDSEDYIGTYEVLPESEETLTPEENGGQCTAQWEVDGVCLESNVLDPEYPDVKLIA